MGPSRDRTSTAEREKYVKVAASPLTCLATDPGGLFRLSKAGQLEVGWHSVDADLRDEGAHFTAEIKRVLHEVGRAPFALYPEGETIAIVRRLVEEGSDLQVTELQVRAGWLDLLHDPPADENPSIANSFWATGASTSAGPVYGGPDPPSARFQLLPKLSAPNRVAVRFKVPSSLSEEEVYVELRQHAATSAFTFLGDGIAARSPLLEVRIGTLREGYEGSLWPRKVSLPDGTRADCARFKVTSLRQLFCPTDWPVPAAAAAAADEEDEESSSLPKFRLDREPVFGHSVLRGKTYKLMCFFHILGVERVLDRPPSGGGDDGARIAHVRCLEQDGTETIVPIDMTALSAKRGACLSDRFKMAGPGLGVISSVLTASKLDDLLTTLERESPPVIVKAPLRFGLQPNGTYLTKELVLTAGGSHMSLNEAGVYIDTDYLRSRCGLLESAFPVVHHVESPSVRFASFNIVAAHWADVFGNNSHAAWLSLSYGVASFHYQHWQRTMGSWPTAYNFGPKDCGKSQVGNLVKALTGVKEPAIAGTGITEAKLAQSSTRARTTALWSTTTCLASRRTSPSSPPLLA